MYIRRGVLAAAPAGLHHAAQQQSDRGAQRDQGTPAQTSIFKVCFVLMLFVAVHSGIKAELK